ncbi:HAD family hydrolase [Lachnospira multipara]|uniref:Phosphoglycolate phosphatase n=1 Tax=Lachnospira multipara TaxID=28051 RepID=A0A1H5S9J5_9FIRM|nr:HAD family hydrolase [Lachnospira multipara]SEF47249.1 phosphoglycolate phosphatase [Lachnospira multipara]
MEMNKKYDGLIFDLDGTMWNSTKPIVEAWNIILGKHPEIKRELIVEEDLTDCMGKTMYTIAAMLFPKEEEAVRNALMDELCLFENEYLEEVGGVLYPKLEETLKELSKEYPLYIVSNCQDGYIEAFLKAHKLAYLFKDTECWGRTFVTKGETNKILIKRNNLKNPVYIGDTQGDKQSAVDAGIDFIFASYGFGNVDEYNYKIEKFEDLTDIL